ncbi:two component transcriptional regulator, winged helix family [Halothece sp. PCC 7418]|nr:two component transcriptional regulator, winged helix family [Halothece sp. PCC 7418]
MVVKRNVESISIHIVEGNPHLRSLLGWHLQQAGFSVCQSGSIQQAKSNLNSGELTLLVLDSDLPDGDSLEFCYWLHRYYQAVILMLSARHNEADIVAGLKAGADDYLVKPFGMREFMARVQALARRFRGTNVPLLLDYGQLKINLAQRKVYLKGEKIEFTPQEFSLLYVLAQAQGLALSRLELLRRAWPEAIDNPRTIDTHILSLRKKLETNPRQPLLIQTVRNVGYRLNVDALSSKNLIKGSSRTPLAQINESSLANVSVSNIHNQESMS